jgi:uncharacterized pyridoxamine 5'-phosphate oxidase family protein
MDFPSFCLVFLGIQGKCAAFFSCQLLYPQNVKLFFSTDYLKDVLRQLEQNQEAARTIANKNYQNEPLRQLAETLTPENWTQPK